MQLASMAKKIQTKKMNEMQQSHKEDDDAISVQSKQRKMSRPQTVTENEKGDTFLTDMLFKKQMPLKPAKPSAVKPPAVGIKGKRAQSELKKPEEKKSDVDSEEY